MAFGVGICSGWFWSLGVWEVFVFVLLPRKGFLVTWNSNLVRELAEKVQWVIVSRARNLECRSLSQRPCPACVRDD
ncbi:hypothetical protein BCR34DRAFT_557690 [Clohesyomyces aquaticus]|uniref:Uncharacterized protein n=1 Tax=Clohesyomyces aquaticus TaxID=1231657 RepID=A0A1Y2A0W5_9PLEO|nr:hypothetical protein BCR34DRAFT_557690 [Clohesyomyces aquaticus]